MEAHHPRLAGRLQEVLDALGDEEPSTVREAQAITEKIRISKGHLDDEVRLDLENLMPRNRDLMLAFVERNRDMEAAYTSSISEQLYSSKYRFLYELIQNADDSSYRKDANHRAAPYVRFSITPETILIDSNEDGFTRANVEAICATGKSSKKASTSDTHIGEKGFGFKSVFSIAHEVHIQSGVWSFRFQHHPQDNGLGMVIPLDAELKPLPDDVSTRITLKISDTTTTAYKKLLDAVTDIPETTIFFLQRLQKIQARMTRMDGSTEMISITKAKKSSSSLTSITRSQELGGITSQDVSAYLRLRYKKHRMPQDRRRKDKSSVTIDLAFPVDPSTMKPKVSERGQYVFAYLPLQRLPQIQFLIQSDFITAANRESVIDCPWNDTICTGVAEMFCWAVSQSFTKADHSLRYSWLEYLPTRPMEHPWKSLLSSIKDGLKTKSILQSWEKRQLKPPSELRQLPTIMLHEGRPILKDLANECYLAPEYSASHSSILSELGARIMSWTEMVDRLQMDLVSLSSAVRTSVDESWQEAFARLILVGLRRSDATCQQRIKRLAIIPLAGGSQWTGAPGTTGGLTDIYFPTTGSIRIPDSISLSMVALHAASNGKRKELYTAMGVKECPVETVLSKIKQAQLSNSAPFDPTNQQLRYLFHFHPQLGEVQSWRVWVALAGGTKKKAFSQSLYHPSYNEYDMYQLLPEQIRYNLGTVAGFLSSSIVDLEPSTVRVRDRTWKDWLTSITNARHYPPLRDGGFGSRSLLSQGLQAVLQHNPEKFLCTLKAHWNEYQQTVSYVNSDIRNRKVPCQSGSLVELHRTYLPTPDILSRITALGLHEAHFHILVLPDGALTETTYRQWQFLEQFGVASKPDLSFYKQALEAIKSRTAVVDLVKVQNIYEDIARMATVEQHADLQSFFTFTSNIWDPHQNSWVDQDECIWQGPDFMSYKTVLAQSYGRNALLTTFFTFVLQIPDWTIDNVLEEIELRRDNDDTTDLPLLEDIYSFLNTNVKTNEDWQKVKDSFSEETMILGEDGSWHTRHTCLWRSPFPLTGFQDLSNIYPELEDFFVRHLRIKKASPGMLIDEVKRMANEAHPRISEIHRRLVEIGMLLAKTGVESSVARALDALKEVEFLPKKLADGTLILVDVEDDFAISDHPRYGNALSGHGVLLDFRVDEVQILHAVFQHLGLQSRYLSVMVQEVSRVGVDSSENESLSTELQSKAYALYCCAAKYMSIMALRDDHALFDRLKTALIFTTDDISTHLTLPLGTPSLSVQSDRAFIHHEEVDGQLRIYVPAEQQQCRACYRSQMPELLTRVLGVDASAKFNISSIVASSLRDLDDILTEQDVPSVDWIEKPAIDIPELSEDERPRTPIPHSVFDDSDATTIVNDSGYLTPRAPSRYRDESEHTPSRVDIRDAIQPPSPAQYPRLIEQVVQIAQRAGHRREGGGGVGVAYTPPRDGEYRYFDHVATFGNREVNEFAHDRRIGAVGEAFVFEVLSTLNLPDFTQENWQSTIRGELQSATRYESMQNWVGRETADIVYTDHTGALTQYLRDNCTGSFPEQIPIGHDHTTMPIEYYLEVKSTTSACNTRFYLSSGQYKRMENMALIEDQRPNRVYVIVRIYNLTTTNIGFKIFIDPLRLEGIYLDFEVQQWIGKTL
ncbi:uncharacterized protein K460DRAFT_367777 [Cucurbitaria berberidis CBS 394.84]|uniref:Protein NO VEIN C-terminal domain-containing protein n=1 Tax=Cucurbitaria berberidis CBS 394.84 TaxID=1168544 RepID=A0A9P4GC16_9PLEO|nr:uncharacterized protein K460DRAFT_367777 [Cucurbitaria berberidis CBS 394.84]KAF1842835.1 hypothetical protein K460DRAFT_367777 [Cucurbitaria berberidis CBS 394.84]